MLLQELARAPSNDLQRAWQKRLQPGDVVGRFEILREIARGGFGVVYEALDRQLGRSVALKTLRPARTGHELSVDWILQEAEAVARLDHPAIVTLHDVGRCEWGPYLVEQLLHGRTLEERLHDGPLSEDEAVAVGLELARGLAHAHGRGVLHQDLKPGNVFLTEDGRVKLLDFGLAHLLGTRGLQRAGTPAYMAPEQLRGEAVDARADVFALGATLFEALAGRAPFEVKDGRSEALDEGPPPVLPEGTAAPVARLLGRCLSRDPAKRPASGQAVVEELLAIQRALDLAGLEGRVPPAGTGPATTAVPALPSVAVMSFADMSPQHDQEYLADGVAEQILNALARVEALRVPGRTSSFYFKGKDAKLSEIARELRVGNVLEGSVRKDGARVRVTAQLVRVEDEQSLWSETYDRELTGIFAVQDGIAQAVVEALRVKLLSGVKPTANNHHTRNPEAYSQYLLGRRFWARGTNDGDRRAADAYRRALALDPDYAPAHAWLGIALYYLHKGTATIGAAASYRSEALEEAEKAVALAPDLADAYMSRGSIRHQWLHDWSGAQADLSRAVSLNPGDSSAHRRLGAVLAYQGQLAEGIREVRRATELDPLDASSWNSLAQFLEADGRLDEAMSAARRALEISPEGQEPHYQLAREYLLVGEPAASLEAARSAHDTEFLQVTAIAEHELGREPESRRALEQLIEAHGHVSAEHVAEVYAWIGDKERAFKWLDAALDQDLSGLKINRFLRDLHQDLRFTPLLRKMNLSADGVGRDATEPAPTASIAVLPFADMSPQHDQEYLADGIAEEILNALAQVQGLKVIGRTSSFSFKGKSEDLRTIGRKLGVRALLEGSVRKEGNHLRVTAQLVGAEDGSHLWSQIFDRDQAGVFAVQEEIAQAVVAALRVKLLSAGVPLTREVRTGNSEVYRLCLLGRDLGRRGRTLDEWRRALTAYEQALGLDPEYAPAWAGVALALTYIEGAFEEGTFSLARRKRALDAADRAIALAPDLPDGYWVRADIRMGFAYDWQGADADLKRARTLGPSDADVATISGLLFCNLGRFPEAIDVLRRATALDPLSAVAWARLGLSYTFAGDLDRGREALRSSLDVVPQGAAATLYYLIINLVLAGRPAEALAAARRCSLDWIRNSGEALALKDLGGREEARAALERLITEHRDVAAYQIAEVLAWDGERDRAFEWLERAYSQRDPGLQYTRADPLLRRLHDDTRWKPFLHKLNLPVD